MLSQTCSIYRWSDRAANSYYETDPGSYSVAATNVPCLIQQKTGKVSSGPDGTDLNFSAVGYFLPSQDIRPGAGADAHCDKVIYGGAAYKVVFASDQAGKGRLTTAYLTEF